MTQAACELCGREFIPTQLTGAVPFCHPTEEKSERQKLLEQIERLEITVAGLNQEKRNWHKLLNEDILAIMHTVDNNTQRFDRFERNQGAFTKRLDDVLATMEAWIQQRGKVINQQLKGQAYEEDTRGQRQEPSQGREQP